MSETLQRTQHNEFIASPNPNQPMFQHVYSLRDLLHFLSPTGTTSHAVAASGKWEYKNHHRQNFTNIHKHQKELQDKHHPVQPKCSLSGGTRTSHCPGHVVPGPSSSNSLVNVTLTPSFMDLAAIGSCLDWQGNDLMGCSSPLKST